MTSPLLFSLLAFSIVYMAGQIQASIVITPADLSLGNQYRLVFITSGSRDAMSFDIADYNSFVNGFGDVAIESDWKAIATTLDVDA